MYYAIDLVLDEMFVWILLFVYYSIDLFSIVWYIVWLEDDGVAWYGVFGRGIIFLKLASNFISFNLYVD